MTPDLERAERLAEYFEESVEDHNILKGMGRATDNEAAENATVIAQALRACIAGAREENWVERGGSSLSDSYSVFMLGDEEFFQRALTVQG